MCVRVYHKTSIRQWSLLRPCLCPYMINYTVGSAIHGARTLSLSLCRSRCRKWLKQTVLRYIYASQLFGWMYWCSVPPLFGFTSQVSVEMWEVFPGVKTYDHIHLWICATVSSLVWLFQWHSFHSPLVLFTRNRKSFISIVMGSDCCQGSDFYCFHSVSG